MTQLDHAEGSDLVLTLKDIMEMLDDEAAGRGCDGAEGGVQSAFMVCVLGVLLGLPRRSWTQWPPCP